MIARTLATFVPRLGALVLLFGFGLGVATFARTAYAVGTSGYSSWLWMGLFLLPTAAVGVASAVLVMRRQPLGLTLARPFAAMAVMSAIVAFVGGAPVGGFLEDYEAARLADGLKVPPYEAEQGMTPAEYADSLAGDLKVQSLYYLAAVAAYVVLIRWGRVPPRAARQKASARA
ncbi:MAG: hypothetical protein R3C15_16920 [Thermoleophilia bacterium]